MSRSEQDYRAETEFLVAKRKRNLARCTVTRTAMEMVALALDRGNLGREVRDYLEDVAGQLSEMADAGYDLSTTSAAQLTAYIATNLVPAGVAK